VGSISVVKYAGFVPIYKYKNIGADPA